MDDAFAKLGLGDVELDPQFKPVEYPTPTPGRIAHIDADFIAYQVSAETKDELQGIKPRKSFEDMKNNAAKALEHLMLSAGAVAYRAHITPTASDKGGRNEQAVQQEYQGNRKGDKERPEFLDAVRGYIGQELNGVVHLDQEADDGMARANYAAMGPNGAWGDSNKSVIVSKDKDLRMVPGLHYDFDSETVVAVGDHFGSIWIDDSKSTKTLKGWGTKFFWAQCLMGDTADNIKGIPAVGGKALCAIAPTKAYTNAIKSDKPSAEKIIAAEQAKTKTCGAVLTHTILQHLHNDADCFKVVRALWTSLEQDHGYQFTHWRTGEPVSATQALLGDMRLLWMRRNDNPDDVLHWLKEKTT